jgi:phosphoglycolate phosphatase
MSVKAVIFDLDGTLLHSIVDIADACNHVLQVNNLPVHNEESYVSWIGNGAAKLVERALPDSVKNNPEKVESLIQEYKTYYLDHLMVKSHLYEGIADVLTMLKQHKIPFAVNTNKPHDQTLPIVENYMKDFLPDLVLGQKDNNPKKPDPFAANWIAEQFQVDNKAILFVGDSYVDIKTGKAAGMQTLGVTWGYGEVEPMQEAGCSIFTTTTSELLEYVKNNIEELKN